VFEFITEVPLILEVIANIFNRLGRKHTPSNIELGLGLSICKEIVTAHGHNNGYLGPECGHCLCGAPEQPCWLAVRNDQNRTDPTGEPMWTLYQNVDESAE
jgi:hypothetical protein